MYTEEEAKEELKKRYGDLHGLPDEVYKFIGEKSSDATTNEEVYIALVEKFLPVLKGKQKQRAILVLATTGMYYECVGVGRGLFTMMSSQSENKEAN